MALVNGGQIVVEVLKRFQVTTAFTLHGGHLDSIYQAARDAGIRVVDTRHEQGAGFAASAFARSTGKLGVALVTAGGGITNVVSAVANANVDCVPMLVIGGAPSLRDLDCLPVNAGVDQMGLMKPITKWAVQVPHISRLADLLGLAMRKAQSGRPGPVYVEIPIDVAFAEVEDGSVRYLDGERAVTRAAPAQGAVGRVLDMLAQAERPAIMAGGGVLYSRCAKELREFAELANIPVLTNAKSRGALPSDHPLWARGFATLAPAGAKGLAPDVILVLGARFGIYTGGQRKSFLPPNAKVIQVDIEPAEAGRIRDPELAIAADCGEMLRALLANGRAKRWSTNAAWVRDFCAVGSASKSTFAEAAAAMKDAIHPFLLVSELAAAAPRDAVFCLDGGESHSWIDTTAHTDELGRWLGHGYVGSMGEGLPLAVGAQVANPGRKVILFTGDGSIGFNFAEFDTLVRHKLPVVVVIANDGLWGMSAHGQDLMYGDGKRMVSELGAVRYDLAAQGFGCHAEFVRSPSELGTALRRAIDSGKPACVNVLTNPAVMHPITQRFVGQTGKGPGGGVRVPYADELEA